MTNHVTIKEAMTLLNKSESTVRRLLKNKTLHHKKRRNKIYIPVEDIQRLIQDYAEAEEVNEPEPETALANARPKFVFELDIRIMRIGYYRYTDEHSIIAEYLERGIKAIQRIFKK